MPGPIFTTKLGVAPARIQAMRRHPVAAARPGIGGKTWLFLGLAFVVVSAITLVVVLAT